MQDAIILYENGKAIGGEGHPTDASDITFDNSNTDLVSENVEGAIVEVNEKKTDKSTVLWENPSPTASFATQNITLDSDDYDILEWYFYFEIPYYCCMQSSLKGYSTILSEASGTNIHSRIITRNSDTSFTVGSGYRNNAQNDTICSPIKVIGRKL